MNRFLFFVCLSFAHAASGAVDPGLARVFDVRDRRIDWNGLSERGFQAALPADQRALIIEQSTYSPLESIRRLTGVFWNCHSREGSALAIDLLLDLKGWQEAIESLFLETKEAWDNRLDKNRDPLVDVQGMGIDAISFFGVDLIGRFAAVGSTDAVLIAAPFLFERTPPLMESEGRVLFGSEGGTPLVDRFAFAMVSAKKHARDWAYAHSPDRTWQGQRLGWRRWWVAHAREFGAEPPSSEDALFEEVLELCRAARRAHPNARFEPVGWPATETGAIDSPNASAAALDPPFSTSAPSDKNASATHRGSLAWWPAALIPLILVILFLLRRGSRVRR